MARDGSSSEEISDAGTAAVEAERFKVAHALWHAAEVGTLRDGVTVMHALFEWLRENFLDPVSDALLQDALGRLRQPRAATDPGVAADVWDVAVKLTLEGQPRDAGKLLKLLSAVRREPEVAELAALLLAYPTFDAAAAESASAFGSVWDAWHVRARAARSAGLCRGYSTAAAEGLVAVLAGDVVPGLRRISIGGTLLALDDGSDGMPPYTHWVHALLNSALYATSSAGLGSSSLRALAQRAMEATGEPIAGEDRAIDSVSATDGNDADIATLNAAFLGALGGDVGGVLRALSVHGHAASAAHLADLVWAAGCLSAPAMVWSPWEAPLRAHMLLELALAMPAPTAVPGGTGDSSTWRAALSYAVAVAPSAVEAEAAVVRLGVVAAASKDGRGATRASAGGGAAFASDAAVEVAVASGSSAVALSVARALLESAPILCEDDVVSVCAAATRLQLPGIAAAAAAAWSRTLASRSGELGGALLWALRCAERGGDAGPLVAVSRRLMTSLEARVEVARVTAVSAQRHSNVGDAAAAVSGYDAVAVALEDAALEPVDAVLAAIGVDGTAVGDAAQSTLLQMSPRSNDDSGMPRDPLTLVLATRRYLAELLALVRLRKQQRDSGNDDRALELQLSATDAALHDLLRPRGAVAARLTPSRLIVPLLDVARAAGVWADSVTTSTRAIPTAHVSTYLLALQSQSRSSAAAQQGRGDASPSSRDIQSGGMNSARTLAQDRSTTEVVTQLSHDLMALVVTALAHIVAA